MDKMPETIYFSPNALRKALFHSLIINEGAESGNMVIGVLGGKLENETVTVFKSFPMSSGTDLTVSSTIDDLARISMYDQDLSDQEMFSVGWYCSIPSGGSFYGSINKKNHVFWQMGNPKAIVLVIYPNNILNQNFSDCWEILRFNDLNSQQWVKLSAKIINEENDLFFSQVFEQFPIILEKLSKHKLSDEQIDDYLNKILITKDSKYDPDIIPKIQDILKGILADFQVLFKITLKDAGDLINLDKIREIIIKTEIPLYLHSLKEDKEILLMELQLISALICENRFKAAEDKLEELIKFSRFNHREKLYNLIDFIPLRSLFQELRNYIAIKY